MCHVLPDWNPKTLAFSGCTLLRKRPLPPTAAGALIDHLRNYLFKDLILGKQAL